MAFPSRIIASSLVFDALSTFDFQGCILRPTDFEMVSSYVVLILRITYLLCIIVLLGQNQYPRGIYFAKRNRVEKHLTFTIYLHVHTNDFAPNAKELIYVFIGYILHIDMCYYTIHFYQSYAAKNIHKRKLLTSGRTFDLIVGLPNPSSAQLLLVYSLQCV